VGREASLTRYQWAALRSDFNLADGHSKQDQGEADLAMLSDLVGMYTYASTVEQDSVQEEFAGAYFAVAGQAAAYSLPPPLYHYSASISIAIVSHLLAERGLRVSLMHPTFDNIPDLLRRHGAVMRPLPATALCHSEELHEHRESNAVFLVAPNNPSGEEPDRPRLEEIAHFCAENEILLIVDFSFRFFSRLTEWDQYEVLRRSGVRFVCIEDTGKTWPSLDLKLGMLIADSETREDLEAISDDYLLNVSPFIFTLLRGYIAANTEQPWRREVVSHREELARHLTVPGLSLVDPDATMSVAWMRLPPGWDGAHLAQWLTANGVSVCPGPQFFWATPDCGREFIRVALLRPRAYFQEAVRRLGELTERYAARIPMKPAELGKE
jgi:aspartate/methionine/tyrosine aminotransferase